MADPPAGDPPADPPAGDPPGDPPRGDPPDDQLTERELRYKREAIARRREVRAAQQAADALRGELETMRTAQESETDKRVREAVDAAVGETKAKYDRRLFEATVLARAAGRFRDPEDAIRLLPIDELENDPERLEAAFKELLEQKPYLAAGNGQGSSSATPPLVTQGARSQGTPAPGDDPDAWIRARARGNR